MQTATRPYTPAKTCYLKSTIKWSKWIARYPGTSSESCHPFKKGGGWGGHWKLTQKPEPGWLQAHGNFKSVGILSLISSQRNDSHPLCRLQAAAAVGWTISLRDSDDEAGWRRERVRVLIDPGPENVGKVVCQVLAVLAASWCHRSPVSLGVSVSTSFAHLPAARLAAGSRREAWCGIPDRENSLEWGAVCLGSVLCGQARAVMTAAQRQSTRSSEMRLRNV